MNDFLKKSTAVFLNFALLTNQLLADLPPITFDSMEWVPYQAVGQNPASGWQLFSGNSIVSPEGAGYNGGTHGCFGIMSNQPRISQFHQSMMSRIPMKMYVPSDPDNLSF